MTVTAQRIRGDDSTVSQELTSASFGIVLGYAEGAGGKVHADGSPIGDLTPPSAGWKYTDDLTGLTYQSIGTTSADWELVVSSESLANTPTVAGTELQIDGKQYIAAFHPTSVTGTPYVMSYTETVGQEVTAITPATETTPQEIGVPVVGGIVGLQWFQTGGLIEALVDGTADVAAGDFLEVINAGVAFIKDATTIDLKSAAVAVDAQAVDSAVIVTIMLMPTRNTVSAT